MRTIRDAGACGASPPRPARAGGWFACPWRAAIAAGVALALAAVVACGSSAGAEKPAAPRKQAFQKVMPSSRVYALDDLLAAGFKKSATYNVEGLVGATAAVSGFWGLDPYNRNRKEYEVRFYESHADAVEYGAAPADEATGDDARLEEDTATWTEGLRDRKRLASGGSDDLAAWSGSVKPKYGDYAVFANMVILCEGINPQQAMEICASLVAGLQAQAEAQ
ncbi:MAG: hypothetical protein FJ313_05255 [Gemmatimonadetes bacterium]|nr:hypothetical protein [Gemmatimonadota bacterium]